MFILFYKCAISIKENTSEKNNLKINGRTEIKIYFIKTQKHCRFQYFKNKTYL